MKAVKKIGFVLGGLFVLLVVIGFILPSTYSTERSLLINAPAEVVFSYVNDLEKANEWSPWKQLDPTLEVTYGEKTVGVGAYYEWNSEDSGVGKLTIAQSTPNTSITTDLDFGDQGQGKGHWKFEAKDDGTMVTWGMSGDAGMNPFARYFGLFIDGLVGGTFELGLNNLKQAVEATPAPAATG